MNTTAIRWMILFVACTVHVSKMEAQNTIGTLTYDPAESLGGYHLIYPERQSTVYLLDECGQIVHRWEDEDEAARPGAVAYILPDGRLLRAKRYLPLNETESFAAGGAGGVIQLLSWENEVLWTYVVADSVKRQHHDVHYMPNGNILILAYERFFEEDVIANGFDTLQNNQRKIWSEQLLEVDPVTDSIVWEWHLWDHLVQEYDSTKLNYGDVSTHPERVDFNYHEFTFTRDDWIHANAIDYNEALDQIIISARNFNELWIIDHSTTSEEAAGSSGGNSDRGGDLLWRWGSPHAYDQGTLGEQQLFYNHDAQWIDDFVDPEYEHYGAVAVFNNFIDFVSVDGDSRGQIITPVFDADAQTYTSQDSIFLPLEFSATFSHPDSARNFSTSASSIQIMGDGHVIMCAARQGRSFELDENGAVVWEYLTPLFNGEPFTQGFELSISDNFTFRVDRYPPDYSAFIGRDLTPQGYLELEPNEDFCMLVATENGIASTATFRAFPNPFTDRVTLELPATLTGRTLEVWDARGRLMKEIVIENTLENVEMRQLPAGVYFIKLNGEKKVYRVVKL